MAPPMTANEKCDDLAHFGHDVPLITGEAVFVCNGTTPTGAGQTRPTVRICSTAEFFAASLLAEAASRLAAASVNESSACHTAAS